jgi:hypothetical protein
MHPTEFVVDDSEDLAPHVLEVFALFNEMEEMLFGTSTFIPGVVGIRFQNRKEDHPVVVIFIDQTLPTTEGILRGILSPSQLAVVEFMLIVPPVLEERSKKK